MVGIDAEMTSRVTVREALKEGCHERERAWMGVYSTEKVDTKRDSTRMTVKTFEKDTDSHYGTCWSGNGNCVMIECPKVRGHEE